MPTLALPSYAHIQEARLKVALPVDDVRRVLNRKNPVNDALRELWSGELVFAPMTKANTQALHAFFAYLDGRTTPFKFTMTAGYLSHTSSITGQLNGAHIAGNGVLAVDNWSASGTIKAGTLLSLGSVDSSDYQACEVLEDVAVTSGVQQYVPIAPRLRWPRADNLTVTFGAVQGKFQLVQDDLNAFNVNTSYGVFSVPVIEALT